MLNSNWIVVTSVGSEGDVIREDQYKDSKVMVMFFFLIRMVGVYRIMFCYTFTRVI